MSKQGVSSINKKYKKGEINRSKQDQTDLREQ